MSERTLRAIEKRLDAKLKKQVQNGLAEVFDLASCKAVAREIKAGRKVTGNAEFGIRVCIHPKIGPRYDPSTKKFSPMTAKAKKLEKKYVNKVNDMLEAGGFRKMSPKLISGLRKKDKAFERRMKKRYKR